MAVDSVTVWTYVDAEDKMGQVPDQPKDKMDQVPDQPKAENVHKAKVHVDHKSNADGPTLTRKSGISIGHPGRRVTFAANQHNSRRL